MLTTTHSPTRTRPFRALSLRLPTTREHVAPAASMLKRRRSRWLARWPNKPYTPRRILLRLCVLLCSCFLVIFLPRPRHLPEVSPLSEPESPPHITPLPVEDGMHAIGVWEQDLPGNVVSQADEVDGRYLRFSNENWGVGFNNQLQEIILHAHLAYLSNRTYVLPPLNFPRSDDWYPLAAFVRGSLAGSPAPWPPAPLAQKSPFPFPLPLPRLSSPSKPQHPPDMATRPRAVTRDHFHRVCPDWEKAPTVDYEALERRHSPAASVQNRQLPLASALSPEEASARHPPRDPPNIPRPPRYGTLSKSPIDAILGLETEPAGNKLLEGWANVLRDMPEGCVIVDRNSEHVFDYRLFGSPRVITLLPSLLRSPVLDLQWSSLVHGAVQRNLGAWRWVSSPQDGAGNQTRHAGGDGASDRERGHVHDDPDTHAPLDRVLALHLRQGDFKEHCEMLGAWGSGYLGVNEAVGLNDTFRVPDHGNITPAQRATFQRHCWPTLPDILARVRTVRAQWQADYAAAHPASWASRLLSRVGWRRPEGWRLDRIYVLTNGERAWWEEVRGALREEGWDVRGSRDMDFAAQEDGGDGDGAARRENERVVGQAVDMAIAVRAEVFIGNGFSSLTSNVNLLRLAHDAPGASMRFW